MEKPRTGEQTTDVLDYDAIQILALGMSVDEIKERGGVERLAAQEVKTFFAMVGRNADPEPYYESLEATYEYLRAQRRRRYKNRLTPELEKQILNISLLNELYRKLQEMGTKETDISTKMREEIRDNLTWNLRP